MAAALFVALGLALRGFTVDDAFIVGRYARNVASGAGYAFNPGAPPSDGVTGPLWLLPGTLAALVGADPVLAAKWVGLACGAAACLGTVWLAARRAGGRSAAWLTAVPLVFSADAVIWSVAGLGSGAALLLSVLAAAALLRRPAPSGAGLGLCLGMLAWLRPECALLGGSLLIACAVRDRRAAGRALLLSGALAAALVALRLLYFGHALPLSAYAKGAGFVEGAGYLLRGALWNGGLGAGVAVAGFAAAVGGFRERSLAFACLAHLGAILLVGGDWMPGFRLLLPVLPYYALLFGFGLWRLSWRRPRLATAALLVVLVTHGTDLVLRKPQVDLNARLREGPATDLAQLLADHAERVALVDIGFLAYRSDLEVIDLGAVTDPQLAHLPGGHLAKRIPEALLRARRPDTLVLHSARPPRVDAQGRLRGLWGYPVEQRVAAMDFVRDAFRVVHVTTLTPGYHYIVLQRAAGNRLSHATHSARWEGSVARASTQHRKNPRRTPSAPWSACRGRRAGRTRRSRGAYPERRRFHSRDLHTLGAHLMRGTGRNVQLRPRRRLVPRWPWSYLLFV